MTNDKLNKLAAEKVLGWKYEREFVTTGVCNGHDGVFVWTHNGEIHRELPDFCESIADAWMLMEKLDWFWFQVGRENCDGVRWDVRTYDDYDCKAEDEINVTCEDTAPLAITKACLEAVGVEI